MAGAYGDKRFIDTATTTQVKTGAGVLVGLIVNPGTNYTINIYDATSGTTDQMIELNVDAARYIKCGFRFHTGLRVVTGGTPGEVTVIFE